MIVTAAAERFVISVVLTSKAYNICSTIVATRLLQGTRACRHTGHVDGVGEILSPRYRILGSGWTNGRKLLYGRPDLLSVFVG